MEHLLLTGVTGNIGSHLLYELLIERSIAVKRNPSLNGIIYILIRPTKKLTAKQRLWKEVLHPNLIPDKIEKEHLNIAKTQIQVIEGDIHHFDLPTEAGNQLIVYHLAASVNLGTDTKAREEISSINYKETKSFLEKIKTFTKKLIFVSTAFSRGDTTGIITDDYHSIKEFDFRNPYEEFKMKMEKEVCLLANQYNFEYTIVRPSIVSGRLLDTPKYITKTYTVFYNIGAFFKKIKKLNPDIGKIRIALNPKAGLNIIAVDYVAKALLKAGKSKEKQINLTSTKNVPISHIVRTILEKCEINDFEFTANEPNNKSTIEHLFYKTVGHQLLRYSISKVHEFESKIIRELLKDIKEPDMIFEFSKLYEFAHEIGFDNQNIKTTFQKI